MMNSNHNGHDHDNENDNNNDNANDKDKDNQNHNDNHNDTDHLIHRNNHTYKITEFCSDSPSPGKGSLSACSGRSSLASRHESMSH